MNMFRECYFAICVITANMLAVASGILLSWRLPCYSAEFTAIWTRTWLFAVLPFGVAPACLLSTMVSQRFGRRTSLLVLGVLPLIAVAVFHALSTCQMPPSWFLTARALSSLTVATAAIILPLYMRELCDAKYRGGCKGGALLHAPRICIALGYAISYLLPAMISDPAIALTFNWIGVGAVCAMALMFFAYLPETPHFLIRTKREMTAKDVLIRLKNSTIVDADFRLLCERCYGNIRGLYLYFDKDWKTLLKTVLLAGTLSVCTTVRVFCFFVGDIFIYLHVAQQQQEEQQSVQLAIVGLVQMVATEMVARFIDKCSGKMLIVVMLVGMLIGAILPLAYFFWSVSNDAFILMHGGGQSQLSFLASHSNFSSWIPITCLTIAFIAHNAIACAIDLIVWEFDLENQKLQEWILTVGECFSWLLCSTCIIGVSLGENKEGIYTPQWIYVGQNFLWIWLLVCAIVGLLSMPLVKFMMPERV